MTDTGPEYFGSQAQRALLTRGSAMYEILRDDPRYTYYGRTVGLAHADQEDVQRLVALTRLQGSSHFASVENAELAQFTTAVEAQGITATCYAHWEGAEAACDSARAILRDHPLPADLTCHWIDGTAPPATLQRLGDVALACGVLPPAGAVLRGVAKPGLALVAVDAGGRAVACAGAAAHLHADHPEGRQECWWGMLATDPSRRGARLALILGAMSLLEMQARHGFTRFFTGVVPGNAASEAVCRRIGLTPAGTSTLSTADAALLPGGRMTS